jgi:hypothetical protein
MKAVAMEDPPVPLQVPPTAAHRRRWWTLAPLVTLLAYGLLLRAWDLSGTPCWVDEAESCINALTILDKGVPADRYLGVPVYENTLTIPWPENPEFEFKDSSYSSRGVAVYHGWLPLYSIAASYMVAGVGPDVDAGFRGVKHSREALRRRTAAGRWPSVLFGGLFLLAAFGAAREMYGPEAGWAALAGGAVLAPAVEYARQARYYSATLALVTCACWLLWRVHRRGAWRDFLLTAVVLGLLFHTHVLSFVVAVAAGALLLPWVLRHEQAGRKVAAAGAVVALMVLPWAIGSGFLTTSTGVPSARRLMQFPRDYLAYPARHLPFLLAGVIGVVFLVAAPRLRARLRERPANQLPHRLLDSFSGTRRRAMLFLAAWVVLAFAGFVLLMPAASFFAQRLTLTMLAPAFLLAAMALGAVARLLCPRYAVFVAPVVFVAIATLARQARLRPEPPPARSMYDVVEALRAAPFTRDAKVYATPNDHLIFTLYTGMPVASVAPVRKSFLDQYPGDVFLLELPRFELLDAHDVRSAGRSQKLDLSRFSDADLERLVEGRGVRQELAARGVANVLPPVEELPPELVACMPALAERQREKTRQRGELRKRLEAHPVFNGYSLPDHASWWPVFFYRFIGPEARSGPRLNYAERIRGADARLLPLEWTLYRCPAGPRAGR